MSWYSTELIDCIVNDTPELCLSIIGASLALFLPAESQLEVSSLLIFARVDEVTETGSNSIGEGLDSSLMAGESVLFFFFLAGSPFSWSSSLSLFSRVIMARCTV